MLQKDLIGIVSQSSACLCFDFDFVKQFYLYGYRAYNEIKQMHYVNICLM
jgi:hypothetical protein